MSDFGNAAAIASQGFILTNDTLGAYHLLDEMPIITERGWDTLTRRYYLVSGTATERSIVEDWEAGIRLQNPAAANIDFWVTRAEAKKIAPACFEVTVQARGLVVAKGHTLQLDASTNSQTAENVTIAGELTNPWAKVVNSEPQVSIEVQTVLIGSAPDSALVGRNKTPPFVPAVAASLWTSLADPTIHVAYGWVLMGTPAENVAPGIEDVWLVTERYDFVRKFSP